MPQPNPFDQFDEQPQANPFDQFDEAPAKPQRTWGDVAKGVGENVVSLGTSMATAPVAEGVATALEAPPLLAQAAKRLLPPWLTMTVGPGMAALRKSGYTGDMAAEDVMRAGTFQPRTEAGQDYQGKIATVMEPVGKAVEFVARGGDVKDPLGNEPSEFGEHAIKLGLGVLGAKGFARPAAATARAAGNAARAVGRTVVPKKPGTGVVPYKPSAAGEPPPAPESAAAPPPRPGPTPEGRPTPTLDELRDQADAAYAQADKGPMIKQADLMEVAQRVQTELAEAGARPKLHPATFAALEELQADAARTDVIGTTAKGVEGTRRVLANARAAAANADDARMAGKVLDIFDDWFDNDVGGQYAPARALWTRYRKGVEIEELIQRARDTASSKFSQSGLQNAIMNEFRALVRNPRRMRKFTPAEQKMLKSVINGNFGAKTLRWLGKLAPTSALPIGTGFAGVLTGATLGGPMGAAGMLGLPLAGGAARMLSTAQTMNRARAAGETMRRGAPPPPRPPYPYPLVQQPGQREQ